MKLKPPGKENVRKEKKKRCITFTNLSSLITSIYLLDDK